MKNYDELTNDLLERRNRYVTDQKRKRKTVISVATSLCCVCLVALLGIGVWQGGMLNSQSPISLDDSTVIGEKDYINPDGFDNSLSSNGENISVSGNDNSTGDSTNKDDVCDILGMVVIDEETYLQFFTDSEAYTLDACLGDASDYEGTYRTHLNDIAAKLYTAKEDSNVLIVELGNGGTVVLKKVLTFSGVWYIITEHLRE